MIYPADDKMYDIEQKVRRNKASDDEIFLLQEIENYRVGFKELENKLLKWANDYWHGKKELIPTWINEINDKHENNNDNWVNEDYFEWVETDDDVDEEEQELLGL